MQLEYTRFINKVNKTDTCWLWTGTTYRFGYGHFRRKIGGKWGMCKTHRYSYEYHKGPIPEGMLVLHKCDNPLCVNPEHLVIGTHADNTQQCIERGRKSFGNNPLHKPHKELAMKIRVYKQDNPEETGRSIAVKFDTSPAQVSRILNNKIWQVSEEV